MSDIEIIMIDDGSTDGSGEIADKYTVDSRFHCIHTDNRGLSAARNRGINEATAEWIMFVDSDDWVEPDFCEIAYKAAKDNQADIVVFQYYAVPGRVIKDKGEKTRPVGLIDKETAIDIEGIVVWRKLYHKKLFDTIRFPEGTINEDILTTHKLIYSADHIYSIQNKLYHYRKRRGSISHSNKSQVVVSEYEAKLQRYNELVAFGYPTEKAIRQLWVSALRHCGKATNTNDFFYKNAIDVVNSIEGIPNGFNLKQRLALRAWRTNYHLFRALYWLAGKRQRVNCG